MIFIDRWGPRRPLTFRKQRQRPFACGGGLARVLTFRGSGSSAEPRLGKKVTFHFPRRKADALECERFGKTVNYLVKPAGPSRSPPTHPACSSFVNVRSIDCPACPKHVKVIDTVDQEVGRDRSAFVNAALNICGCFEA